MDIEPGELLASGRAADVFDQGDGTVLRRYRTAHDCEPEARLMSWLDNAGFPVPKVHDVSADDILMERITGPTMLEDLDRRPWMVLAHVKVLADLQRTLNDTTAPEWLPGDERVSHGSAVLHLDLHPMNVIIGPAGPVVIDWTNALRGDGDFDAALSYILMAAYEAKGWKEVGSQQLVVRAFRRFRGTRAVDTRLVEAARFRLQDENVTPAERKKVAKILERTQPPGS